MTGAVGNSNPAGAHRFNSRVRPTAFYRISCWTHGQHIRSCNERLSEAAYAPSAEPALLSCCPLATPRPCSSISTKSQRKSPPAHTPFSFSIKLDGTAPKTSRLPKTSRSCGCRRMRRSSTARKYLAIHAGELAVEPHLQILRRNRRSLLLRLEYAHPSTVENHVHRSPRLGSRRSLIVRLAITLRDPVRVCGPRLSWRGLTHARTPPSLLTRSASGGRAGSWCRPRRPA